MPCRHDSCRNWKSNLHKNPKQGQVSIMRKTPRMPQEQQTTFLLPCNKCTFSHKTYAFFKLLDLVHQDDGRIQYIKTDSSSMKHNHLYKIQPPAPLRRPPNVYTKPRAPRQACVGRSMQYQQTYTFIHRKPTTCRAPQNPTRMYVCTGTSIGVNFSNFTTFFCLSINYTTNINILYWEWYLAETDKRARWGRKNLGYTHRQAATCRHRLAVGVKTKQGIEAVCRTAERLGATYIEVH